LENAFDTQDLLCLGNLQILQICKILKAQLSKVMAQRGIQHFAGSKMHMA